MKKLSLIVAVLMVLSIGSLVSAATTSGDTTVAQLIKMELLNQDPDPVSAGDVVEIRLGITNEGGQYANNIIFEVVPEYPFTLAEGQNAVQKISTIKSYQLEEDMKNGQHSRLGTILSEKGIITLEQLDEIIETLEAYRGEEGRLRD